MKNKKSLLIISTTLLLVIVVSTILFSTAKNHQNSHKIELSEEYGPLDMENVISYIGDGMYVLLSDGEFYTLYSRYAKRSILCHGLQYDIIDGILYFYSEDGDAVVYPESNLCKVYLIPREHKTERIEPSSEYPLNKLIVYLDYFDEFTQHEQDIQTHLLYTSFNEEKIR